MALNLSSFSDDCEYLAHSTSDGILRIYECATGKLKQEYRSNSHLSAITSTLSWRRGSYQHMSNTPKRRKLAKSDEGLEDGLSLIALGTTSGSINLYSFSRGSLHSQLTGGHTLQVNAVCWQLSIPELISCSEDQTVVQWDLRKGKVKHKWKCDTSSIHTMCLCSEQRLVTASHIIKLWDLSTRSVLQTFTGHSTPIFSLQPVWIPSNTEATYLLSSAVGDRHISVWSCDGSKKKTSVATFSVPDEPVSVSQASVSAQNLTLSVISRKGVLYIFEVTLNGSKQKPMSPKSSVEALFKDERDGLIKDRAPILASSLRDRDVILAFGNPFKPLFESFVYDATQPEVKIYVNLPVKAEIKEEFSQVKRPEISEHLTTFVPAGSQFVTGKGLRRKKRSRLTSVTDMTVEERLNAMGTETPTEGSVKQPPLANTLSRLLQQGLLSGDYKILVGVFQETNEAVVRNTVKRLPVSFIVPLVKEIDRGMSGHAQHALSLSRWTAALISCHTSYILSVPEIINTLNRLYETLSLRQRFYPRMLQLKGRLELVKYTRQTETEETGAPDTPLIVYQDELESDGSDSMIIDGAGIVSDENWEDLSDVET